MGSEVIDKYNFFSFFSFPVFNHIFSVYDVRYEQAELIERGLEK